MKLSRKKFNIQFDVNGYFVWEIYSVFGIRSITFYGLNGNVDTVPFKKESDAEEKVWELEQLEEIEGPLRDGSISFFLNVILSISLLIYLIS